MRPIRRVLTRSPKWLAACLAALVATLIAAGCRKPTAQAEPPPPTAGVVESRRTTVPVVTTPTVPGEKAPLDHGSVRDADRLPTERARMF